MEAEEDGDDHEEGNLYECAECPEEEAYLEGVVFGQSDHVVDQEGRLNGKGEDQGEDDVEQEQHEELAVVEAHAVGDPGTVVVHVEDAALAGGAVVAPKSHSHYRSGLKLWQSRQ